MPISFDVFASLLVLVADFKIEEVDGHSILINNKYHELKFTDCIDTLFSIIDGKYPTDTFVPLETILFTVPNQYKSSTKELITHIASDIFKVHITEDGRLFCLRTTLTYQKSYTIYCRKR